VARGNPLQSPPTSNTAMLVGAARRFGVLLGATTAVIAACSLGVGALLGASLNRSVATGFEGFGSLLLVLGFFVGNRGPVRLKVDATPFIGPRFLRWATPEEHRSTIADSAIFIVLGLVLIVLGLAIDSRYRLV
jgi:uncharacterized membrane protein